MTDSEAEVLHRPDTLAARLRDSYCQGAIAPLSAEVADTGIDAAYAVQDANTRFWIANGRVPVGCKTGLTSNAVQAQLGVDQPDFGILFEDMYVADGGTIAPGRLLQPKVEAEIAFIMGADAPDAHRSQDAFLDAVETIHPALEIVDSRIAGWRIALFDTVADNASCGLFVLGKGHASDGAFDFAGCAMTLHEDGEEVSAGRGSDCLGSPIIAGTWLARTMHERGRPLAAGDVVLSGALGPMVAAKPGSRYEARIEGLSPISVTFDE